MRIYIVTIFKETPGGFRGWDTYILRIPRWIDEVLDILKDHLGKDARYYNFSSAKVEEVKGNIKRISSRSW